MRVIVEERQHRRCPPAGVVARSLHATRHARRSRLASGPGGLQQSANVILRRALSDGITEALINSLGETDKGFIGSKVR